MDEKIIVTSNKYSINWRDLLMGFFIAFGTAFVATGGQAIEAWIKSPEMTFDHISLVLSLKSGFAAGVAYLFKKFIEPQKVITITNPSENDDATNGQP
jgi:hypothetical protein